jgi:hypothetical protein
MVHFKSKLRNNGKRASPYYTLLSIVHVSGKCFLTDPTIGLFKYVLIGLSNFLGMLNSMRMLFSILPQLNHRFLWNAKITNNERINKTNGLNKIHQKNSEGCLPSDCSRDDI